MAAEPVPSVKLHASGSETRQRDNTVTIRLDDNEFARVKARAAECDMSVTAYLRHLAAMPGD
jgi:predicted DNA binding CopG/RHH family protein